MHCHVTCVIRVYIQVGTSLCGGRKCSPTLINGKKERKKKVKASSGKFSPLCYSETGSTKCFYHCILFYIFSTLGSYKHGVYLNAPHTHTPIVKPHESTPGSVSVRPVYRTIFNGLVLFSGRCTLSMNFYTISETKGNLQPLPLGDVSAPFSVCQAAAIFYR